MTTDDPYGARGGEAAEQGAAVPTRTLAKLSRFAGDPDAEARPPALSPSEHRAAQSVPAPASGLANLPPSGATVLLGRDGGLAAVRTALDTGSGVITQQAHTATVHGLGGIGKTALALRYAQQYRTGYQVVWWLNAETEEQIASGLADLAAALQPDWAAGAPRTLQTTWALAWLRAHPGWLLVYDNAEDPLHLTPYLGSLQGRGHQLITSRRSDGWPGGTRPIPLDVLAPDTATELLCWLATGGHATPDEAERAEANALARELGFLPLALTQAGAYLRQTGTGFATYRSLLVKAPKIMLGAAASHSSADRTVARIWQTSLVAVRRRCAPAGPLLSTLAWFAPEAVPRELLTGFASGTPATVDTALQTLADYSLVTLGSETVTMHRLLQAVLRAADCRPENGTPGAATASGYESAERLMVTAAQPGGPPPLLLPHIQALAAARPPGVTAGAETVELFLRASEQLIDREQKVRALALLDAAVQVCTEVHGPDADETFGVRDRLVRVEAEAGDPDRAVTLGWDVFLDRLPQDGTISEPALASLANLAYALRKAGRAAESVKQYRRLVTDRSRILGPDHPDTLTARNDLAYARQNSGEHREAVREFAAVTADRARLLGPDAPDTLVSRLGLAFAHRVAGDHKVSIELYQKAAADRARVLGPDNRDTLASRGWLATAHLVAGHHDEALALFASVCNDLRRVLGDDHPDTLAARGALADGRRQSGDWSNALKEFQELADDYAVVMGPEHPDALDARDDLASVIGHVGRSDEAIQQYRSLVGDYTAVRGPGHSDTLYTRWRLADFLSRAGYHQQSVAMFEQLAEDHRRYQGGDHHDALDARHWLAHVRIAAGDHRRALAELQTLLADERRILGADHPTTLNTLNGLAYTRQLAGDHRAALLDLRTLLSRRERVQGPEHPATLTARGNLAFGYRAAEEYGRERDLLETLLQDRIRIQGPEHPDTLDTREYLAANHQISGDCSAALVLRERILEDRVRIQGLDHPDTLTSRMALAETHRETGRYEAALRIYEELRILRTRLHGPDHRFTWTVRFWLAYTRREAGQYPLALTEFQDLLADERRMLGTDHLTTMTTLNALALTRQRAGDYPAALDELRTVLEQRTRVQGPDHADTLTARANLAFGYRAAGEYQREQELLEALVRDRTRVQGSEHPDTYNARYTLAHAHRAAGDHRRAVRLLEQIIGDERALLGNEHVGVLRGRAGLAYTRLLAGEHGAALQEYTALAEDRTRVQGAGHPEALDTRTMLVHCHCQAGDHQRAIHLLNELIPDRVRSQGPDDPDTLNDRVWLVLARVGAQDYDLAIDDGLAALADCVRVLGADHIHSLTLRDTIASARRLAGDLQQAVTDRRALLRDRTRIHGPDHPSTLTARTALARVIRASGDEAGAIDLHRRVVQDRTRVQGPMHTDTLKARDVLAAALLLTGQHREALAEFASLLEDRIRVQGPDHQDTLGTRLSEAHVLYDSGDPVRATEPLQELVRDQLRVHGPDHADTFAARDQLAHCLRKGGRAARAAELHEELAWDRARVQGADHTDTLDARDSVVLDLLHDGRRRTDAVAAARQLVTDGSAALGAGHLEVLAHRERLAEAMRAAGDITGALREHERLLADLSRLHGADHVRKLEASRCHALLLHAAEHRQTAVTQLTEALGTAREALGQAHPDVLWLRTTLTVLNAGTSAPDRVLRDSARLVAECERVFGAEHRITLRGRRERTYVLLLADRPWEALAALRALLSDLASTLGHRFPDSAQALAAMHRRGGPEFRAAVLTCAERLLGDDAFPSLPVVLARALAATGDAAEARELLAAVSAGRSQVFGPDAPETLESRAESARLSSLADPQLLADLRRTYGKDHPGAEQLRRELEPYRPLWVPRVILDEDPVAGRPVDMDFRLEPTRGANTEEAGEMSDGDGTTPLPPMILLAAAHTAATIDPPVAEYLRRPLSPSARFRFRADTPGTHTLRFTVYERESGVVLQDLEVGIDVTGETAEGQQATPVTGAPNERG